MKTTMISILLVLAAGAGCASYATSPSMRSTAARLFAEGKNPDQIARELQVDRDHARSLIRTGMADLNKKFYTLR